MPVWLRLAALGVVLVMPLACAGSAPSPRTPPDVPAEPGAGLELPDAEMGTQRLFRVRYQGPEGNGRLRLVLRLEDTDRFAISTADLLGRALWSVSLVGRELLLVNHRGETFCRTVGEVTLPEVALAPVPLRAIPGVLLGYLPAPGVPTRRPGSEAEEIREADRRWTLRRAGAVLEAWTLWVEEDPVLWWTRQPGGGILSHRRGAQFRWRQVVVEPLGEGRLAPEVPDGYRETSCHESAIEEPREDQPPPGGPGPAG